MPDPGSVNPSSGSIPPSRSTPASRTTAGSPPPISDSTAIELADLFSSVPQSKASTPTTNLPKSKIIKTPTHLERLIEGGRYIYGVREEIQASRAETGKVIDLGTTKINDNKNMKMFLGVDQKIHILVHREGSNDDSLIEEYSIKIKDFKNLSAQNGMNVYHGLCTYKEEQDFKLAKEKDASKTADLNAEDASENGKLLNWFANYLNGDINKLNNVSGFTYRKGRGIEGLAYAEPGAPSSDEPLEYTSGINEFDHNTTGYFVNLIGKETLDGKNISSIPIKTKWFNIDGYRSSLALVESKDKDKNETYHFRLYVSSTLTNGQNQIEEFKISPTDLQKLMAEDHNDTKFMSPDGKIQIDKVTNNIENIAKYLRDSVTFDTDDFSAHINRRAGKRAIAEIASHRKTAYQNNIGDTVKDLYNTENKYLYPISRTPYKTGKIKPPDSLSNNPSGIEKITAYIRAKLTYELGNDYEKQYEPLTTFSIANKYTKILVTSKGLLLISWEKGDDGKVKNFKSAYISKNSELLRDAKKLGFDFTNIPLDKIRDGDAKPIQEKARLFFGYKHIPDLQESNIDEITKSYEDLNKANEKK